MLRVREAAELLGCTLPHVRLLIRTGVLKAKRVACHNNQYGYEYRIRKSDLRPFMTPSDVGRPRSKKKES